MDTFILAMATEVLLNDLINEREVKHRSEQLSNVFLNSDRFMFKVLLLMKVLLEFDEKVEVERTI